jgi:hypothetical protein
MKTARIVAAAIISAIIGSVQAEEATLQWCVTLHKQFLAGIARKVYALANAVVCETSKAPAAYHEHYQEFRADEEEGKQKFLASSEGSTCKLEIQDAQFELMKGKTEEEVGGAMSVLMPPKQRIANTEFEVMPYRISSLLQHLQESLLVWPGALLVTDSHPPHSVHSLSRLPTRMRLQSHCSK